MHHELSDEELMRRVRDETDEAALQALTDRYAGPALLLADSRLKHTGLSDEAVQDAFLKIYRERRRYDERRPFAPWFYAILRNACADHWRRETRYRDKLEDAKTSPTPNPPTAALDAIGEGLAALSDPDREILILRLVQGLEFQEIGCAIGCTEDAAKKRGQRALKKLRSLVPFTRRQT